MDDPRFPGAPPGSWITDEGWLVVGDECWTPAEWHTTTDRPWKGRFHSRYANEGERSEARRATKRAYMRRRKVSDAEMRRSA